MTNNAAMTLTERRPETVLVCVNRRFGDGQLSCAANNSEKIAEALADGIQERRIAVNFERSVCMGQCLRGPTIRFAPGGRFILGTSLEDVTNLLDELEAMCGTLEEEEELPLHLIGS